MKTKVTILFLLAVFISSNIHSQVIADKRQILIDFNKTSGIHSQMYAECIGAGRANEGLRADWQEQLKYVKEECGFKYIRMHGLLTDDMGVYFEDKAGNPVYNWQYIDKLFDYLLSIKMKPFVELGFMPNALASGSKTVFWWRGNITPPKDYQKWSNLIKNLVLHCKERYGDNEIKTWYFEVWNEPNLKDIFFSGDQNEYFKLYTITANAIKDVSKAYKVGGPATAGSAWVPEFISYCSTHKVPVDFISTHTYGVNKGFVDTDGSTGTVLSQNPNSVSGDIVNTRKQIANSAMPWLELHYTEWSSSYTPTDPIHDSYHQAAYILDKIKNVGSAPNSMSYWVFTDIFEENGPRTTPFHGGFGLLNYQGIKKPAFYSYQFLHRLGEIEFVNKDAASWACKDKKGNIQLLWWNFTITHPGDSVNNQVFYKRDLPAKAKGSVQISLQNIPEGNYTLKIYQVGYRVNDAYSTYMDLGSPKQITRDNLNTINNKNSGKPVITSMIKIGAAKSFEKMFPLRENDVFLLELNKN